LAFSGVQNALLDAVAQPIGKPYEELRGKPLDGLVASSRKAALRVNPSSMLQTA
jgi:hypothetical protein